MFEILSASNSYFSLERALDQVGLTKTARKIVGTEDSRELGDLDPYRLKAAELFLIRPAIETKPAEPLRATVKTEPEYTPYEARTPLKQRIQTFFDKLFKFLISW